MPREILPSQRVIALFSLTFILAMLASLSAGATNKESRTSWNWKHDRWLDISMDSDWRESKSGWKAQIFSMYQRHGELGHYDSRGGDNMPKESRWGDRWRGDRGQHYGWAHYKKKHHRHRHRHRHHRRNHGGEPSGPPVPEPTTALLLMLGLGGLAGTSRRMRSVSTDASSR